MIKKVVILGGGIAGLSTGYFLAKRGFKPIILEKEKDVGGLASWYNLHGIFIDKSYHIFFPGDEAFFNLLKETKLYKDIIWGKITFDINQEYGNICLSSPPDIIKSNLLTIKDKLKLFWLYLKIRNSEWKELDKYLAKDWIIKQGNANIYKNVFKPLIDLKWGSNNLASAAWFFGRIKPRSHSMNIFSYEKAGYLNGSLEKLFSKLRRKIEEHGGKILNNTKALNLIIENNKVRKINFLSGNRKGEINSDIVISTIPLPELIRISNFSRDYKNKLERVRYVAVICACFLLKKKLTKSYRTIINKEGISFGGIVELTNLISPKTFKNHHIVYVFNFLDVNDRLWKLSDDEILETYIKELSNSFPEFDGKDIVQVKVYRNKYGEPIYKKNYLKIMPKISTPIKGLFITGLVQSYPISDCNNIIKLSKKTCNLVENYIRSLE